MSTMKYNKNPISLREGKVVVDGLTVADSVKCHIIFTPDVWTGRQLGEITPSSRWIGGALTGDMTRRRSTPFLKDAVKHYMATKETPEFTIQGIMDDENSDYFEKYGTDVVTVVGCVLTGGLNLTALESDGQVVEDNISFNGKALV